MNRPVTAVRCLDEPAGRFAGDSVTLQSAVILSGRFLDCWFENWVGSTLRKPEASVPLSSFYSTTAGREEHLQVCSLMSSPDQIANRSCHTRTRPSSRTGIPYAWKPGMQLQYRVEYTGVASTHPGCFPSVGLLGSLLLISYRRHPVESPCNFQSRQERSHPVTGYMDRSLLRSVWWNAFFLWAFHKCQNLAQRGIREGRSRDPTILTM